MFPLLKLPFLALVCVMKAMECAQVFRISNISKRCYRLVRAVKLPTKVLSIKICTFVEIKTDIPDMCRIQLRHSNEFSNHLERNRFQLRAFFDNASEIFQYEKVGLIFNFNHISYPIQSIKMAMNGLDIQSLRITNAFSNDYIIEILNNFLPVKILELPRNPYKKRTLFHNVLRNEFEILELGAQISATFRDLLVINSAQLIIQSAMLSVSDMNNLLKRWTEGWNSRMKYMYMTLKRTEMNEVPEILSGINHQQVMEERRMVSHDKIARDFRVGTVYEISKVDGTKAVLYFRECTIDIDIYFTII
ncbi:unnamed protein product [Caenorhabditis brenneri]